MSNTGKTSSNEARNIPNTANTPTLIAISPEARKEATEAVRNATDFLGIISQKRAQIVGLIHAETEFQTQYDVLSKALSKLEKISDYNDATTTANQKNIEKQFRNAMTELDSVSDDMSPSTKKYLATIKQACEEMFAIDQKEGRQPLFSASKIMVRLLKFQEQAKANQEEAKQDIEAALGGLDHNLLTASLEDLHALKGRLLDYSKEGITKVHDLDTDIADTKGDIAKLELPAITPEEEEAIKLEVKNEHEDDDVAALKETIVKKMNQRDYRGLDEANKAYQDILAVKANEEVVDGQLRIARKREEKIADADFDELSRLKVELGEYVDARSEILTNVKEAIVVCKALDDSFEDIAKLKLNAETEEERKAKVIAYMRSEKGEDILKAMQYFRRVNEVNPDVRKLSLEEIEKYITDEMKKRPTPKPGNGGETQATAPNETPAKKKPINKKTAEKETESQESSTQPPKKTTRTKKSTASKKKPGSKRRPRKKTSGNKKGNK